MLYRGITSSVLLYPYVSKNFPVSRGVRQGCPLSALICLITAQLLYLHISNNRDITGLSIFNREIKITQLADDTVLFLKDKTQVPKALQITQKFSDASGLKLNILKSEILCLYDTDEGSCSNVPIKNCVKYLGIHIFKDNTQRQSLHFLPKLQKTKLIFNMWLQRDLSIYGRVLLMKADGISRFVYPTMSLYVVDQYCKDINNTFVKFVWKNGNHYLKKEVIQEKKKK